MNLREKVVKEIHRAVDGTIHYAGEEKAQNADNLIQIAADRSIGAFVEVLPEPVDLAAKYETDPTKGLQIRLGDEADEDQNGTQLTYLARFADDQGYNRYYRELMQILQSLYMVPHDVVQSEHEQRTSRTQQEDSDQSGSNEPSKVS